MTARQLAQCPGVGHSPAGGGSAPGFVSPRGLCPCCWRVYALRVGPSGGPWVMRSHKGLPVRPDGGCPYRCPPDCDFDCYTPESS